MATPFKLQYLIIISVCLHLRSSYGFPHDLSCNGVQIITYGKPCYSSHQLPVTIEKPVEECVTVIKTEPTLSTSLYRPLNLEYRTISMESPTYYQLQKKHPISIQIPQPQITGASTIQKITTPDLYRGKSYKYDIQTPSAPYQSTPISMSYNFDLQVPSSNTSPSSAISTPKSIEFLTGLSSKIDKILIPACETSSINKLVKYDISC